MRYLFILFLLTILIQLDVLLRKLSWKLVQRKATRVIELHLSDLMDHSFTDHCLKFTCMPEHVEAFMLQRFSNTIEGFKKTQTNKRIFWWDGAQKATVNKYSYQEHSKQLPLIRKWLRRRRKRKKILYLFTLEKQRIKSTLKMSKKMKRFLISFKFLFYVFNGQLTIHCKNRLVIWVLFRYLSFCLKRNGTIRGRLLLDCGQIKVGKYYIKGILMR